MAQDDVGVIKHPLHLQGSVRAAAHVVALKTNPNPQNEALLYYCRYLPILHISVFTYACYLYIFFYVCII